MKEFNNFSNISTATTTVVKTGAGTLKRITLNEPTTAAVTVYDNTAGSGTTIATIATTTPAQDLEYNLRFATGLTIVTAGADDITVVYSD